MTKKNAVLISIFVLIVGSLYFYLYKDWFVPDNIRIISRVGSTRLTRPRSSGAVVFFAFNKKIAPTEVKVVLVSDIETNKYAHPVWHLISNSKSVPMKGFAYGEKVPGMKPAVEGVRPETLKPNVAYRLIIDAHSIHGEHDFKVPGQQAQ